MAPIFCCLKAAAWLAFASYCSAQTFQRLGSCPTLGCILPPDQADFLPGQYFDIRVEVHAPLNGSQAIKGYTVPDSKFTLTIEKEGGVSASSVSAFFKVAEPAVESWNFTWYEDLFAQTAYTPSQVRVAAKAYRKVALTQPGKYVVTLTYQGGKKTTANWTVRDIPATRKAKNVLMFVS